MKRDSKAKTKDLETHRVPGESSSHEFVREGERVAGRLVALVVGVVFVIVGVGLSVTMVLLPVGIPLGVIGLVLIYGGACYGSVGSSRRG